MTTWKSKLERSPPPSLRALRERLSALLQKPDGSMHAGSTRASDAGDAELSDPRRPADPTVADLPFLLEDTPSGPLYFRRQRPSAAHRVGRARTYAALDASRGILALLALDARLSGCDPARALYIDTETTGLMGGTGTIPFLLGMAWFDEDRKLVTEQLLLRQLGEEAPMLERFSARLRKSTMLVSYNGKSFDLPLLRTRMLLHRVPAPQEPPHLDLVHVARRVHKDRMRAFNLGLVESHVLGFERTNDIPSADVGPRYHHYLRTADETALREVVDHNDWDVVSMVALVGLYGEPLDGLGAHDLVGVARTFKRARSLELADVVAARAVERGAGKAAIRVRGEIAQARGDKARALLDFASLAETVDDPALRLTLAKLYEHHAREPLAALDLVLRGTGESHEATARRRARLETKRDRSPAKVRVPPHGR